MRNKVNSVAADDDLDIEPEESAWRTDDFVAQITRYGPVEDLTLIDALDALSEVNDDIAHARSVEVVIVPAIRKAIAHLETLITKLKTDASGPPRPQYVRFEDDGTMVEAPKASGDDEPKGMKP